MDRLRTTEFRGKVKQIGRVCVTEWKIYPSPNLLEEV